MASEVHGSRKASSFLLDILKSNPLVILSLATARNEKKKYKKIKWERDESRQ
jgi:hypothetical protein